MLNLFQLAGLRKLKKSPSWEPWPPAGFPEELWLNMFGERKTCSRAAAQPISAWEHARHPAQNRRAGWLAKPRAVLVKVESLESANSVEGESAALVQKATREGSRQSNSKPQGCITLYACVVEYAGGLRSRLARLERFITSGKAEALPTVYLKGTRVRSWWRFEGFGEYRA